MLSCRQDEWGGATSRCGHYHFSQRVETLPLRASAKATLTGRTSAVNEIRQSEREPLKGVIWVRQRRGRGVVRIKCEAPGSSLECHWRSAASLMTNQHPSPRLGICLASCLRVEPGANLPRRHSAIRVRRRCWAGQGANKTLYRMSAFNLFEKVPVRGTLAQHLKKKRTETGSGVKAKGKDTEHQSAHCRGDRSRLMRKPPTVENSETSGFMGKNVLGGRSKRKLFDSWPCDSNSDISIRLLLVFTYHQRRRKL